MKQKIVAKFKKYGYTLIELMLVLAIIGSILVMSTRYYQTASSAQKVNTAADMIQNVINASEDWRMTKGSYSGVNITELAQQGLIKADMTGPWGGGLSVESAGGASIKITLTAIPKKECNSLDDIMQQKGMKPASQCDGNTGYSAEYPK